jgi:putative NIF3 family GTP cyclohydrolase 1 type 2
MGFDELAARAKKAISPRTVAYDNCGGTVNTIAILSGSGDSAIDECPKVPFNCLITGEFPHKYFHDAEEMEVSVLSCGHYDSETTGIQELMKIVERCCKLETVFIDAPTGL